MSPFVDLPPAVELPANPVWRSYPGGQVLRAFRGGPDGPDDHFPEDWLASSVLARNGAESRGAQEGISPLCFGGEDTTVPALLARVPKYCPQHDAGAGSLGVLLKLLDSAARLHLQAHPDDAFARARLGGTVGKTECWYILSTRSDDAAIFLGFQRPPTPERWREMIAAQDVPAMLACFDPIPVRAGDCFVVPAGVPHAIGAGVFMLELQQPSDWVVRCEFAVGGYTLPESARFMGLSLDECLEIFDYRPHGRDAFRQIPRVVNRTEDFIEEEIIGSTFHSVFRLHRLRGTGPATWDCADPGVVVVVAGSGSIRVNGQAQPFKRGGTLLLPSSALPAAITESSGPWELLVAKPPLPVL